jgi:very-short-patch-repair endonuclease
MDKYKTIKKLTRELRNNQTEAEAMLWQKLRNRKLDGYKFLRQYPIVHGGFMNKLYFFIADFYCAEKTLVIELDGKIHENQKEYDEQRNLILKEKNVTTLRFKNEELKNMEMVLLKIKTQLKSLPSNTPLSIHREGLGVSSYKIKTKEEYHESKTECESVS